MSYISLPPFPFYFKPTRLFKYSCDQRSLLIVDNDMINGTKLLNVAGMSRGKRDGILKSEKVRSVVKVGAMHLKGVWYVPVALQV